MQRRKYIETDVHTANLVELLRDEIRSLHEKVDRLERNYVNNSRLDDTAQFCTQEQTSRILNISIRSLYTLRQQNKIPYKRVNGKVMFLKSDIEKYLEK